MKHPRMKANSLFSPLRCQTIVIFVGDLHVLKYKIVKRSKDLHLIFVCIKELKI